MGGASEFDWMDVEDLEALAAYIFQVCDTVAYGISLTKERAILDKEYGDLDSLLASLSDTLPFVVGKSAAHITLIQRMRQLAARYKELEVETYGRLEGARRLGDGLVGLLLIPSPFPQTEGEPTKAIVDALRRRSPSIHQAMRLAVQRMQNIAQQLMATSAAHKAVSRDMDIVVCNAADIVEDPTKCDVGIKAAPLLGATAGGSLGLLLLSTSEGLLCTLAGGALGPVAAVALGSLGAMGANELTQTAIVPQVKAAFQRMYDEASQVSSLIDSKATALAVIAEDLLSASVVLQQLMDLSKNALQLTVPQLLGPADELHTSLASLLLRCQDCRQRLTAFAAVSYAVEPALNGAEKGSERRPLSGGVKVE